MRTRHENRRCTMLSALRTLKIVRGVVCGVWVALFPGLHTQLLLLAVRKVGGRPGRIMRAAADVTYCS